jgi:Motility related/secretion protein
MVTAAGAVALVVLVGIPGLPGLSLPKFGKRKVPADSVVTMWTNPSRLALRNEFVLGAVEPTLEMADGSGRIRMNVEPRQVRVRVDPDSGEVIVTREHGEVALGFASRQSLNEYSRDLVAASFQRQWRDRSRQDINSLGQFTKQTGGLEGTGLQFTMPGLLPKQVQSLLGPGSPAINVSGSENIRISGQSNWTNQQTGPLGQKKSLFPSLDMQQDLNIRLEGQLSDRVKLNLLQNSLNQIPLANRIAINYKGDEDDLVQALDLGNTNLSLPGTQYVSYSGRNEGLFGVKATTRSGPLDFTFLASKQEGKSERASYAGGASRQAWRLYNDQYVRGVYFFLYDPNLESLDVKLASIKVYRDDGNPNSIDTPVLGHAYLDPRAPDTALVGTFRLLNPGADQDYEVLTNVYGPSYPVLRMRQPLSYDQKLAITYEAGTFGPGGVPNGDYVPIGGQLEPSPPEGNATVMKLIRAPLSALRRDGQGNFIDAVGVTRVRHLELKNFYQLPGQRIEEKSLVLSIERGDEVPPITFVAGPGGQSVPFLEVLGLDNLDESTGNPVQGHDARVDGTIVESNTRAFVDFATGTLFFPDLRPFAPRLDQPFERAIDSLLFRRARLDGSGTDLNAPNPIIYDRYNPERRDALFRIAVEFTAQSVAGEIPLGRGNILEGSEVVTVNGRTWTRDVDYTVDYDLGRIVLKRQLAGSDQLNIDYSYAPLFQQAGRTLIGSAFRAEGRERHLGGAFLYESRGAQDQRPRLGEEPSRSVIGDLNGEITFRPDWMTRMVDKLPGVRTTAPSDLKIQAEVGASFPNPNTKNEVYLDDMEGVRDAVSLTMVPERWRLSSVPSRWDPQTRQITRLDRLVRSGYPNARVYNAEVHWYSPFSVFQDSDLKPNLSDGEGAQVNRQVLALSVPRVPRSSNPASVAGDPIPGDSLWFGLTYPLDVAGIDLSKSQFIELWVNDFNDRHTGVQVPRVRGHNLRLRVDLGVVSEDQQRSPDRPPNGLLESEDLVPRDNQLDVTSERNEDTGLDKMLDQAERDSNIVVDLATANDFDPAGDNFSPPPDEYFPPGGGPAIDLRDDEKEIDTRRWLYTNGTESNRTLFPFPDTEDLNLSDRPDSVENYFEYTIELGDTASRYLITDVQREFSGCLQCPYPPTPDNGWRRYRIPIADSARVAFGNPDLALTRHVRVWVEGIRTTDDTVMTAELIKPLMVLGGLEIVGSRWRAVDIPDSLENLGSTVTLNAVNSIDNADVYLPPFDPGQTRSGNQAITRREQSMAMEFEKLMPGQTLEAFKSFSIEEDYTRYGRLAWYAASFDIEGYNALADAGLYYFVRFASDDVGGSYYEYRARIPRSSEPRVINWDEVNLALTMMSNLKLTVPAGSVLDTISGPGPRPGEFLSVVGRPSFTRVRRISFGLMNQTAREIGYGSLWFNELRALDVDKSAGYAERVLVNGRFSNLLQYSGSFDGRDENFVSVGEARGRGSGTGRFAANGTLDAHRFFEGTGIVLPVTYAYTSSGDRPRFTVGDDVFRSGAFAAASESRAVQQSWSVSYSRNWSERANPLLRYTLGGITGAMSRSWQNSQTPSQVDTSSQFAGNLAYRQTFRKLLGIHLPFTKGQLFPLPSNVTMAYNTVETKSHTYDRQRDSTGSLIPRSFASGRATGLLMGVDLQPVDPFTYHIDAMRNLSLPLEVSESVGNLNIGRVVALRQNTTWAWQMNRGNWLRPRFSWNTGYQQANGPALSSDLSVREVSNNQNYTGQWTLPFEGLYRGVTATPTTTPRDTSRTAPRTRIPPVRYLLSRLGSINLDGSIVRSSSHSRINGSPDALYLFGFTQEPGFGERTRPVFGNQSTEANGWDARGNTRLQLLFGSSVTTTAEFRSRITTVSQVTNRQDDQRFPDFTIDYGRLATALQIDRLLKAPQMRTAYNRSSSTAYLNSAESPSTIRTSSQWQPLLNLRGDLKDGTKVELGVERRNTQTESFQVGHSITNERFTVLNLSLNRSYSRGQQVSVLGRTSTVKSSVSLGFTGSYEKRSGETVIQASPQAGGGVRNPNDNDRLSLNLNGQYGFSNNITGNLVLGFSQDRDLQREIIRRQLRIEARGSFTF